MWDPRLAPSCWHGVTTTMFGNAVLVLPSQPQHRAALTELMEGVEEIPDVVLADGLSWDGESFPDFLDALERRPHAIDVVFCGSLTPRPIDAVLKAQLKGRVMLSDARPLEFRGGGKHPLVLWAVVPRSDGNHPVARFRGSLGNPSHSDISARGSCYCAASAHRTPCGRPVGWSCRDWLCLTTDTAASSSLRSTSRSCSR